MPYTATKLRNALARVAPALTTNLKNIRVNGQLRGCSGFVADPATGRHAYVDTEPSCYGPLRGRGVLYRTASGPRDFTGGTNRFAPEDELAACVAELIADGRQYA